MANNSTFLYDFYDFLDIKTILFDLEGILVHIMDEDAENYDVLLDVTLPDRTATHVLLFFNQLFSYFSS